jgi:hypothetical protein
VRRWVLAFVIFSLSPAARSAESGSPYPIPDSVVASADEYVISKVGEAFFECCLTWSPALSSFEPLDPHNVGRWNLPDWSRWPRYVIIYRMRVPGKPFVDELVVVNIGKDGRWFEDESSDEGLPGCVSDPAECEFPIDAADAFEIALEAGLQAGTQPWESDFRWSGLPMQTYVWEVRNELAPLRGEYALIDANDGTVLGMGEWSVEVEDSRPTAP